MASQEVVWECLRTQSSFLRKGKKGTPVFSAEPGNLANKHSFKFSSAPPARADADAAARGAASAAPRGGVLQPPRPRALSLSLARRSAAAPSAALIEPVSRRAAALANYKTVVVEAGKGKRVTVTLSSVAAAKAAGLPGKTAPRAITVGAVSGRKLLKAVGAMAAATRPDLRDAAMRRATAVQATICRTLAKANKD